ncbi:cold-shock protein [Photobacterium galatheae]|uniref:CSD domain-containing protein n=1 Tax=Photobacterium galatheae TaxID=1654360 RepID=A0A066RKY0_9GAMM|nr:cold shock domain-containing protein [Photobacterium galatheae]KDM91004.1 hypothetical protein EA58_14735 [Photobacterium galatheae]MCM0149042.1 cold shock domain-containing protein [Photobacterium galatheae]
MAKISGTIKIFFRERGFGFLTDSHSEKDIYFHAAALRKELKNMSATQLVGTEVIYKIGKNPQGVAAIEVSMNKRVTSASEVGGSNQAQNATCKHKTNLSRKAVCQSKAKMRQDVQIQHQKTLYPRPTQAQTAVGEQAASHVNHEPDVEMFRQKDNDVISRILKAIQLDDPKTVTLLKVKVINFGLTQHYNMQMKLSKMALAFVRMADLLLIRVERVGDKLGKAEKPKLKSV